MDRTYASTVERGEETLFAESEMTTKEAEAKLREVTRQTWISSVGFGQITGIIANSAGQVSLLKTGQAQAVATLSSR